MAMTTKFGNPYRWVGPDGTVYWVGAATIATLYEDVLNEDTVAISPGGAVKVSGKTGTLLMLPRWNYAASDDPQSKDFGITNRVGTYTDASGKTVSSHFQLACQSTTGNANDIMLGVAAETIAQASGSGQGVGGSSGRVIASGSACCVNFLTSGTGTVGNFIGSGGATVGLVTNISASTSAHYVLGVSIQTNTVAAPGTGSTGQVGILVW